MFKKLFASEDAAWRMEFGKSFLAACIILGTLVFGLGGFLWVFAIDSRETELMGRSWVMFGLRVILPLTGAALLYRWNRCLKAAFLLLLTPLILFSFSFVTGEITRTSEEAQTKSPGFCTYSCCRANHFCVSNQFHLMPGESCRACSYERFCTGEHAMLKPGAMPEHSSVTCTPS